MFDELFADLILRPVTQRLVTHLLLDLALPPSVLVDFGVDSESHYRALKEVLFVDDERGLTNPDEDEQVTIVRATQALRQRILELDAALGHGPRLNALVKKYAPHYSERVQFCTSMDIITGRVTSSKR